MVSIRRERIGDEIRDLLATCFSSQTLADPRLAGVVITHARVSADLQVAKVYFRHFGQAQNAQHLTENLTRCAPFLRTYLSKRLRMFRVPSLQFFYDESIDHGDRIEMLIHGLRRES